jgi:hypothetical protein
MSLDVYTMPNTCPHCGRSDEGYWANITHNLGEMADKAGMYVALWHPEQLAETPKASDIIPLIEKGLADLKARPDYFRKFNPKNGWGSYEGLVGFAEEYLEALKKDPTAGVRTST